MPQKNSLGRGLGAILPDILKDMESNTPFSLLGIEELAPNRFQPRQDFNDQNQKILVNSIKKNGILQPIVARKILDGYEIIAGERRWRAAQEAGLKNVPVIIREADDADLAKLSLIENIQRESLNPLEEASAYQTLAATFGLSQEDISLQVGKDRSTIANTMRLLKLPEPVKRALVDKKITAGHARSLLALESAQEQIAALQMITKKELNVRDTELFITRQKKAPPKPYRPEPYLQDLEQELSRKFMTKINIHQGKKSGTIEIRYSDQEELKRLVYLMLS